MCGVWFVKMVRGVGGWCVVCIGNGVKNGFVMTHEKANGQYELWSSMRRDELGDMGHFVPIRISFVKNTITNMPHYKKNCPFLNDNFKSIEPTTQN